MISILSSALMVFSFNSIYILVKTNIPDMKNLPATIHIFFLKFRHLCNTPKVLSMYIVYQ